MHCGMAVVLQSVQLTLLGTLPHNAGIRSWWEVPCVAHFCHIFKKPFKLPSFEIEVRLSPSDVWKVSTFRCSHYDTPYLGWLAH